MAFNAVFPAGEIDYNYLKSYLSGYKNIRVKINDMLKKKEIIRIKKGLYIPGNKYRRVPVCRETLSNLIYGPSYISLHYALSFYGMIPERTETVTAVTNKRNKVFDTPIGRFSYRYIRPDLYSEGIELIRLDEIHNVLIASKEKAVADLLYFSDTLENTEDLMDFLYSNMRIDESELINLRNSSVRRLAKIYRGNILILQKYLEEAL